MKAEQNSSLPNEIYVEFISSSQAKLKSITDDDERIGFKIKQCKPELKGMLQKVRDHFKLFEDAIDYMQRHLHIDFVFSSRTEVKEDSKTIVLYGPEEEYKQLKGLFGKSQMISCYAYLGNKETIVIFADVKEIGKINSNK
uniref:Uncharacterized protein n=1 Tax=Acrobeloides nanus TaxID=290746 RepID=A0A914E2T7_9BILA